MTTFTEEQLLETMKQRMGISTSACGVEVVTLQGPDIDSILRRCLQARYMDMLLTRDPALLPVRDIAMQAASFSSAADGIGRIDLPDSVIRVTEIKLPEWEASVTEFTDYESPHGTRLRFNPYSRSVMRPAVLRQGNTLWLYCTIAETRLLPERLNVITSPTTGVYTLDIRLVDELTQPISASSILTTT